MGAATVGVVVLLIWVLLCVLVGWTAKSYQRSPAAWFLLAMIFSPLAGFVFLLVANVSHSAVVLEEKERLVRERHPERTDVREIAVSETRCPQCGATVNPVTHEGLHSPDDEPWLLICNQCQAKIEPDV